MTDDERAFLAAITAAPTDDTVRLVYADWLDEHSQPARAEFIRAQVEAETLHRHSARRAELDALAEKLLAEHWVEWWSPVCESVGLPLPAPPRASRLGRFAQALRGKSAGDPFALARFTIHRSRNSSMDPLDGFETVEFRRGFPEHLFAYYPNPAGRPFLPRWTDYPLSRLRLAGMSAEDWHDGPHLAGVSALELVTMEWDAFTRFLAAGHLTSLEDLTITDAELVSHVGVPPLVALAASPLAAQLKRLSVPVFDDDSAAALADGFGNLTSLEVEFHPEHAEYPPHEMGARLVRLGASRRLAGLRELDLHGGFLPHSLRDATGIGNWQNLRRLALDFRYADLPPIELPDPSAVPALEDLSIAGVPVTPELISLLIDSPLTKRLRHFALNLWQPEALTGDDVRRLADIVDPAKIETFWLDGLAAPGIHLLRQRLGDKLRTA